MTGVQTCALPIYLGRYTHRVAISNNRLIQFEGSKVRFRWKDYRHDSRQKVMCVDASEFIRRFLLHVLPSGLQRIRHYGLLANRHRAEKLVRCRQLLAAPAPVVDLPNERSTIAITTSCSPAGRCVTARNVGRVIWCASKPSCGAM